MKAHISLLLLAALLAGCAGTPATPVDWSSLPADAEIDGAPFYPQEADQCGPAALATVLGHNGIEITPEQLRPKVYLPARGGSLALELTARGRRFGQVVYPLAPELDVLLAEIAAGNPVLVLQNLRFDWWPHWHFAVAIGYDREREQVLLRSGPQRRHTVPLALFDRTWRRAGRWAIVVLPPAELPATAAPLPYLQAVNQLEQVGELSAAAAAYENALQHWPEQSTALMGLGNIAYARGAYDEAAGRYAELLNREPGFAPAWNNMAYALREQGCGASALRAACCARVLSEEAGYEASVAELMVTGASDHNAVCQLPHCPVDEAARACSALQAD